ncbi:hypothetical protein [Merdibacter massiliensis]|uniref:hypothetical protein n=1 Tax=Merdibacter massiliensis TaxID=1871030 RepID=UPI00192A252E|nr:hypothetical protein [Merdibacter massiliensis]
MPIGRASTFEAAGKQSCDCVAWSCKRRTGFISRQGVYENSRFSSNAGLREKVSRTCGHTHKKADGFLYRNRNVREAILGFSRLDYPSAKVGGTVNGGAIFAPFILTVDWLADFAML